MARSMALGGDMRSAPVVTRNEGVAMAAILVAALALRIIHLNSELWYDEILTVTEFVRLPASKLLVTYGSLNNHILYTWLAKASVALFGDSPWALRLPAVLFGLGSIVAAWLLFREGGRRWAAIVVAALMAVSYHHVWFSQNARGYTGILFFSLAATIAFSRAMKTGAMKYWIYYAAFFAGGMLVHLSSVFIFGAHGILSLGASLAAARRGGASAFLTAFKGPFTGFALGGAIVLLFFIPMLGGVISAFSAVSGAPAEPTAPAGVVEWKSPLWTAMEFVRGLGSLALVAPLALAFAAAGAVRLFKETPWIAGAFLLQIPLTLAALLAASMRIWPRYFFADIAFILAAVVFGAFWFAEFTGGRLPVLRKIGLDSARLKIAGSLLMILASLPLLAGNYRAPKQGFAEALALVDEQAKPGDRIFALGLAAPVVNGFYGKGWTEILNDGRLDEAGTGAIWVVEAFPAQARAFFPQAEAELASEFEVAGKFSGTLAGGDVIVYRRKPAP